MSLHTHTSVSGLKDDSGLKDGSTATWAAGSGAIATGSVTTMDVVTPGSDVVTSSQDTLRDSTGECDKLKDDLNNLRNASVDLKDDSMFVRDTPTAPLKDDPVPLHTASFLYSAVPLPPHHDPPSVYNPAFHRHGPVPVCSGVFQQKSPPQAHWVHSSFPPGPVSSDMYFNHGYPMYPIDEMYPPGHGYARSSPVHSMYPAHHAPVPASGYHSSMHHSAVEQRFLTLKSDIASLTIHPFTGDHRSWRIDVTRKVRSIDLEFLLSSAVSSDVKLPSSCHGLTLLQLENLDRRLCIQLLDTLTQDQHQYLEDVDMSAKLMLSMDRLFGVPKDIRRRELDNAVYFPARLKNPLELWHHAISYLQQFNEFIALQPILGAQAVEQVALSFFHSLPDALVQSAIPYFILSLGFSLPPLHSCLDLVQRIEAYCMSMEYRRNEFKRAPDPVSKTTPTPVSAPVSDLCEPLPSVQVTSSLTKCCYKCGSPDHLKADCTAFMTPAEITAFRTAPPNRRARRRHLARTAKLPIAQRAGYPTLCYRCGDSTHLVRKCSLRGDPHWCSVCGSVEHETKFCAQACPEPWRPGQLRPPTDLVES